jgi:hypothetical protein
MDSIMNFLTTSVPTWVSISFILSFSITFFMIANVAKAAALKAGFESPKALNMGRIVLVFCFIYIIYVSLMSFTGIFQVNTLPPRILLFTAIPLLIFYFAVVFRSKIYWTLLENAPLESLIRIHIFRFVGVFFIIAYAYEALPKTFALVGGIGDIFAAVTAIFVANAVENKKTYAPKLALIWNIIGFWDIVNVIVTAIVTTKYAIENGTPGVIEMANFPFCWIAAFAPATIVFLHISIFKKLKMMKQTQNN